MFCGPCYAICMVVLLFCHYMRIQRLGIEVTLLSNIVSILDIAYFGAGDLGFAKKMFEKYSNFVTGMV